MRLYWDMTTNINVDCDVTIVLHQWLDGSGLTLLSWNICFTRLIVHLFFNAHFIILLTYDVLEDRIIRVTHKSVTYFYGINHIFVPVRCGISSCIHGHNYSNLFPSDPLYSVKRLNFYLIQMDCAQHLVLLYLAVEGPTITSNLSGHSTLTNHQTWKYFQFKWWNYVNVP